MRFCKKLGRLASLFPKCPNDLKVPEKLGEVTKETEAAPSEVRFMKRLSPGCGGKGELTVSAAALPEPELMSGTRQLKNTNGSQTQGSKPGLQREVTMKR